jgi:hypothetical protein
MESLFCATNSEQESRSVANKPLRRAYWAVMCDGQRYETEWDGLRIVIEERPKHFQVFIYDPGKCEVLHTRTYGR